MKDSNTKITDIYYYNQIEIGDLKEPLYLVEKQIDGKNEKQLYLGDNYIANINENGEVQLGKEYEIKIDSVQLLLQLKKVHPLSLKRLEALRDNGYKFEEEQEKIKEENEKDEEEQEEVKEEKDEEELEKNIAEKSNKHE